MKNIDDVDEEDFYNKEKSKIINLIMTICSLYDQRNNETDIKLTAPQVYRIIRLMIDSCKVITFRMKELGNPYETDDCKDEEEYMYLNRMHTLYTELILVFFDKEHMSFINDKTQIEDKSPTLKYIEEIKDAPIKSYTLLDLIDRFKLEIIPNLEEPHLLARCNKIGL